METYNFEAVIGENGIIALPESMRNLARHRVRFRVIDLERHVLDAKDVLPETGDKPDGSDKADMLLGLFSDEPELMDGMTEAAMKGREKALLRHKNG